MARVVQGDDLMFNAMTFGRAAPEFANFIDQQWNSMQNLMGNAGNAIINGISIMNAKIAESDIYQRAEAALHYAGSLWGRDINQPLTELRHVQNAPLTMIPYLMAEPGTRKLYNKGRCEGYEDAYVDMQPGVVGEAHDEYRRVMNGVVSFDSDGWESTTFMETSDRWDGVDELTHMQSLNVRNAWLIMAEARADGRDATSRQDNDL